MPKQFVDLSRVQLHAWLAVAVPKRALVVVVVVVVVADWECHAACPPFWEDRALAWKEESIVCLHLL